MINNNKENINQTTDLLKYIKMNSTYKEWR